MVGTAQMRLCSPSFSERADGMVGTPPAACAPGCFAHPTGLPRHPIDPGCVVCYSTSIHRRRDWRGERPALAQARDNKRGHAMKLLYFDDFRLGVLKNDAVVDVSAAINDI